VADTIHVRVVSPEKVVFEGDASALVVPAWDGKVGILPGHAPLLALLGGGELSVEVPKGGSRNYHVSGGVVMVEGGAVTVLAEYAGTEPPAGATHAVLHLEDLATAGNPLV
jgi:F-type H+-transporting ATPase subunit epsilon